LPTSDPGFQIERALQECFRLQKFGLLAQDSAQTELPAARIFLWSGRFASGRLVPHPLDEPAEMATPKS